MHVFSSVQVSMLSWIFSFFVPCFRLHALLWVYVVMAGPLVSCANWPDIPFGTCALDSLSHVIVPYGCCAMLLQARLCALAVLLHCAYWCAFPAAWARLCLEPLSFCAPPSSCFFFLASRPFMGLLVLEKTTRNKSSKIEHIS